MLLTILLYSSFPGLDAPIPVNPAGSVYLKLITFLEKSSGDIILSRITSTAFPKNGISL